MFPWDEVKADYLRITLAKLHLHNAEPPGPAMQANEARWREMLHQIVDELCLRDVWTLYHLGRLLLLVEPSAQLLALAQQAAAIKKPD